MAAWVDDREGAVREVAQVYEFIKIHQPLLLLHGSGEQTAAAAQLAQSLLGEALRALNVALSVMKQPAPTVMIPSVNADEPQVSSPRPAAAAAADSEAVTRRDKRRRSVTEGKSSVSWVNLTTVPYEDGYEWRKYGEKKINGTQFTRNYFRCTYKEDKGCQATKHIQQKDNSDPPIFQVTYNNEHTCNCTTNNSKNLPSLGYCNSSQEVIDLSNCQAKVKQERPVLPALVDVCALPLGQTSCQEPAGNNPLHDLELFLMYDI
ncbi:hypothetical protein ACP4OV_003349 [Aristida adscensionis]